MPGLYKELSPYAAEAAPGGNERSSDVSEQFRDLSIMRYGSMQSHTISEHGTLPPGFEKSVNPPPNVMAYLEDFMDMGGRNAMPQRTEESQDVSVGDVAEIGDTVRFGGQGSSYVKRALGWLGIGSENSA